MTTSSSQIVEKIVYRYGLQKTVQVLSEAMPRTELHCRRCELRLLQYAQTGIDWGPFLSGFALDEVHTRVSQVDREDWSYYDPVQFKIAMTLHGQTLELIDGGFVSWMQELLSDRKERLLISAIRTEMFCMPMYPGTD